MDYPKIAALLKDRRFWPEDGADFQKLGFRIAERSTKKNKVGLTATEGRALLNKQLIKGFHDSQRIFELDEEYEDFDEDQRNESLGRIIRTGFRKVAGRMLKDGIPENIIAIAEKTWPNHTESEKAAFATELYVAHMIGEFASIKGNYTNPRDLAIAEAYDQYEE